jgi:hypothetical protein
MLSKFIKLQSEMLRKHLGCVDQCFQGNFVAWPWLERQGRSRHPDGPAAAPWRRSSGKVASSKILKKRSRSCCSSEEIPIAGLQRNGRDHFHVGDILGGSEKALPFGSVQGCLDDHGLPGARVCGFGARVCYSVNLLKGNGAFRQKEVKVLLGFLRLDLHLQPAALADQHPLLPVLGRNLQVSCEIGHECDGT